MYQNKGNFPECCTFTTSSFTGGVLRDPITTGEISKEEKQTVIEGETRNERLPKCYGDDFLTVDAERRIFPEFTSRLRLTTLVTLSAHKHGGDFSVGHDVAQAGWFGDLVVRRPAPGGKGILCSFISMVEGLKSSADGSSEGCEVTRQDLSSENGPYSLTRYFRSFLKIVSYRQLLGGVDTLTVLTIGVGKNGVSECLERVQGYRDPFLGVEVRVLKDIPSWGKELALRLGHESDELVSSFLRRLRFAEYTPKLSSIPLSILQELPTLRPNTYSLLVKETIEEWFTSLEGKYLTSKELRDVLSENVKLLEE